jgi:hypothetical protein
MRLSSPVAIAAVVAMAVFSAALVAGPAVKFTEGSTWALPGTASDLRWLEIHKIEGIGADAVYHVSVLSRRKADPVWNLKYAVPHMAITDAALGRSVAPAASRMGAAYPETYEEAYRGWRALREKGTAPICTTTVLECAHLLGSP